MVKTADVAKLVRALRNIAWSDDREPGDETGETANGVLLEFAEAYPSLVANDFDFMELQEYLEAKASA